MLRVFELNAPDGRKPRLQAESLDELKSRLTKGYEVNGEVFGAGAEVDGFAGGYCVPLGGKSPLAVMLEHHGAELKAWLVANYSSSHEDANSVRIKRLEAQVKSLRYRITPTNFA